jgi:hypothetical protein
MWTRSFADEPRTTDENTADDPSPPDYVFEGFKVEWSVKIMLTPPQDPPPAAEPKRSEP